MNYLAHSYLAFTEEQIVGQFLEDYVKNNQRKYLPKEIQQGIVLHRAIDTFTDSHPVISEAKKIYQPLVRLYAGAFIDVSFDYFLAHWLSDADLKKHTDRVYLILRKYQNYFPPIFEKRLNSMEKDNWLYNYKYDWGIKYSFENVLNKAKYLSKNILVFETFLENKKFLGDKFTQFFPDLERHIRDLNANFEK